MNATTTAAWELFCKGMDRMFAGGCYLGEEVCWLRASPVNCGPPAKIFTPAYFSESSGQEEHRDHQQAVVRRATIYMPTNEETCKITTKGSFEVRRRCGPFDCGIADITDANLWNITGWRKRNRCIIAVRVILAKTTDWSDQSQRITWSPASPGLS